jgi:hypothetical protein
MTRDQLDERRGAMRFLDEMMIGREPARGIGPRGIARQVKRLAAAPAEILSAPLAAATGLGHPSFASEGAKPW